jgi:hypothetical protein
MSKSILFAIDQNTEEVIVSDTPKGSNKIMFTERIGRSNNEMLYGAVVTLARISKASDFDIPIFKAMDKVCQMLYNKHKASSE